MKKKSRIVLMLLVFFMLCACLMTAVSASIEPRWVLKNMMKTDSTPGIRFCAKVYESLRQDEKLEEYGFIVAACDVLEANGVSVGEFCHESDVKYVSSVNYKASGEEKIDKVFDTEDGIYVIYACVITNIPEKHYRSGIVAKPYIKYDGEITYGASFRVNYLGAAGNMLKSEEFANLSDEEKALVESIANYDNEDGGETEPEEPVVPEDPIIPEEPEIAEEFGYRIIKSSDPYIDENNYYRNCYNLLNPMTGKTESVPGNLTSATASGIKNTAMQIGSIVCLKDGMVDDTSGTVTDEFNAVQSPIHEIDGGKYKAGLVWITKCDIIDNVIEAYNVADGANWYDTGETVTYGFDSNTAVTVLKHARANDLVQWGTFGLLTADDIASSKNDYKCYNHKVPTYKEDGSVDVTKPYKTGYAKYIKAYMVTENKQNLEDGELNKAIFVIVVVNEYENLAHLTTNKKL